ncbi:MAG: thymidine kinase [Fimbriimonadaceae bacterium]|nr:thymidine kinase [Fimbriimonadaceae bacterium]
MKRPGEITVVCGSMFAGKTEELIRRARRALYAQKKVQVFKPAIDRRFDAVRIVSHMGVSLESTPVSGVDELVSLVRPDTDVVVVEECQFFDDRIVDAVVAWADGGKEVVAAGLDQDFRRMPFGPMPQLLALADEVVKLRAICIRCGALASHTQRLVDGKPAKWDDPIVLVGATEAYEARCRRCHQVARPKRQGLRA